MDQRPIDPFGDLSAAARVRARYPLVAARVRVGERDWSIEGVQNQDALLEATEDLDTFPYGLLLWESAVGLARYLDEQRDLVVGKRVLELGAGVGLPGLVARSLGADVLQTDYHRDALVLCAINARSNGVTGVERQLGDWRSWNVQDRFDVILGADILYEREMRFYQKAIFCRNLARMGRLILSDPGRPQALEFAATMESQGWRIALSTLSVALADRAEDAPPVEVGIMKCFPG